MNHRKSPETGRHEPTTRPAAPGEAAARFGFSLDALRNWEQGRRQPDLSARAFLTVIEREPDAVRRALSGIK